MMSHLFLKPGMKGMLSLCKFPASTVHQVAKKLKSSQATANMSNKSQETHKQYKLISCDKSAQRYHPRKKKHKSFKFRQEAT